LLLPHSFLQILKAIQTLEWVGGGGGWGGGGGGGWGGDGYHKLMIMCPIITSRFCLKPTRGRSFKSILGFLEIYIGSYKVENKMFKIRDEFYIFIVH
jgi:hypothetical protein